MTSSAMTPTCPQVEPIKCFTNWTRHPWNFLIQVSLFLKASLIWKLSVLGNEAEDSDEEIV